MPLDLQGVCTLLQVFDMPASLDFYLGILGFEVVSSSVPPPVCDWIWLRRGDIDLMLNTAYEREDRPVTPDVARVQAHDDTCLYFGCPDTDAAYQHLQQHGVSCKPPKISWYGMKQLYFHDPDGYNLCFQWNAPKID